jgi:hypothetical protein
MGTITDIASKVIEVNNKAAKKKFEEDIDKRIQSGKSGNQFEKVYFKCIEARIAGIESIDVKDIYWFRSTLYPEVIQLLREKGIYYFEYNGDGWLRFDTGWGWNLYNGRCFLVSYLKDGSFENHNLKKISLKDHELERSEASW